MRLLQQSLSTDNAEPRLSCDCTETTSEEARLSRQYIRLNNRRFAFSGILAVTIATLVLGDPS